MEKHFKEKEYYQEEREEFTIMHGILESQSPEMAILAKGMVHARIPKGNQTGYNDKGNINHWMRTLLHSGLHHRLQSIDEMGRNTELYWDLCDAAAKEPDKSEAFRSIQIAYRWLEKKGKLDMSFREGDTSPYDFLHSEPFIKFLTENYCGREHLVRLHFKMSLFKDQPDMMISYRCRSAYVREVSLRFFHALLKLHRNRKRDTDYLLAFESWLGDRPEDITEAAHMNGKRFLTAVACARAAYADNPVLRAEAVSLVFGVFRQVTYENPDIDIFKDTIAMNNGFLSYRDFPQAMADGYIPVATGGRVEVPEGKVIFRIRGAEQTSGRGNTRVYRIVDASDIAIAEYRQMYLDFLSYNFSGAARNFSYAKVFILHLESMKLQSATGYVNTRHLYKDEVDLFVAKLGLKGLTPKSYNAVISKVKKLISFGVGGEYMTMDNNAMKSLKHLIQKPIAHPRAIRGNEILAIDEAFAKLSKDKPTVMLANFIFHIQVLCRLRAGSICNMKVSGLKFLSDGSSLYTGIEKTSGLRPVTHYLGQRATDMIKDALEYTAGLRERCPEGYGKECVFIYEGGGCCTIQPIMPMTTDLYSQMLKTVCAEAGIQKFTSGNVRDTYLSAVRKFARDNRLTPLMEASLTGHHLHTSTNNYDDIQLEDLLTTAAEFNLGTVKDKE